MISENNNINLQSNNTFKFEENIENNNLDDNNDENILKIDYEKLLLNVDEMNYTAIIELK